MSSKSADYFTIGVLCVGAIAFGAFGVQWLVDPIAMASPLGIVLTNGDATSDARAVYGGMELGMAAFLLYSASSKDRRTQGLAAAALSLFGLGTCRLIGILLGHGVSAGTYQLLGTDLAGTTLCAVTFLVSRKADSSR
jgi:F0F1-type ATP synthase assembly protein I